MSKPQEVEQSKLKIIYCRKVPDCKQVEKLLVKKLF